MGWLCRAQKRSYCSKGKAGGGTPLTISYTAMARKTSLYICCSTKYTIRQPCLAQGHHTKFLDTFESYLMPSYLGWSILTMGRSNEPSKLSYYMLLPPLLPLFMLPHLVLPLCCLVSLTIVLPCQSHLVQGHHVVSVANDLANTCSEVERSQKEHQYQSKTCIAGLPTIKA